MFDAPECLSPSQELRLLNGLATRRNGTWAASRVADFGGRQGAGKTGTIIARILAGVFLFGEKLIIYTAHEYPTANEVFIRLGEILGGWDDLSVMVEHERRAHGDQGFELKDRKRAIDCRILIKTRTGKSGRGFAKADLIIYDEAQHLLPEHVAGSGPAKLAHPNPQSWYAGSGGHAQSSKAWELRRAAILGTGGRLSYSEHTAQTVQVLPDGRIVLSDPDPEDRDAWAMANPGLGRWVTEEGMEDMRAELGHLFLREGLCCWDPEPGASATSMIPHWALLADPDSVIASNQSWAIAVSPIDQGPQWASIGKAGRTADGRLHVEFVDHRAGTAWIVPRCVELYGLKPIPLRVHKTGPEGALIKSLREAGVEVVEVSTTDVTQATGDLIGLANADPPGLVHTGLQPSLDKSIRGAVLRSSSDGAAVWSQRSSSVEISPLVAVTVAAGGVAAAGEFGGDYFVDLNDLALDDDEEWT